MPKLPALRRLLQPLAAGVALLLPAYAQAQDAPIATGQQTNGKARVEVISLKRTEGDTVTLRFTVVNDNNRDLSMTLGNMHLLDLVNRRRYDAGLSSSCRIPSGERQVCWAMFAAPGANTKTVSLEFYENFDLIPVPLGN